MAFVVEVGRDRRVEAKDDNGVLRKMDFASIVKECEREYRPVVRVSVPPRPLSPRAPKTKEKSYPPFRRRVMQLVKGDRILVTSRGKLSKEIFEKYDGSGILTGARKYASSIVDEIFVLTKRPVANSRVIIILDDGQMIKGKHLRTRGRDRYMRVMLEGSTKRKVIQGRHVLAIYRLVYNRGRR